MLIITYILCGSTWGVVFCRIKTTSKNHPAYDTLMENPIEFRIPLLIIVYTVSIIWESVVWPIDVPVSIYNFIKHKVI